MTPSRKVAWGCAGISGALFLLGMVTLALELWGNAHGAPISTLIQRAWAEQPWVIFVLSHLVAMPTWFLCGHWFGQNSDVYAGMRAKP